MPRLARWQHAGACGRLMPNKEVNAHSWGSFILHRRCGKKLTASRAQVTPILFCMKTVPVLG
jgi:hypothetical protein